MSDLSPRETLKQVAEALPDDCRKNVIVIGSLAAGYYYFGRDPERLMRTKDVDCMLSPHVTAMQTGQTVAERLIAEHWKPSPGPGGIQPGNDSTPVEALPMIRLVPPRSSDWNIELLSAPSSPADRGKTYTRIPTAVGHFVLCSFGYLALAEEDPVVTEFGIRIARPEMMALANLLHHPAIGPERMGGLIEGRRIKRSNKDLGRVLAIASLAQREDQDALVAWPALWSAALRHRFSKDWRLLAHRAGDGIRAMLASGEDLEEARHCVANGLLSSYRVTRELLEATGRRLLNDALEPLKSLAEP
ncbi:MAG: hypothetical protein IPP91_15625 [Betaproteobacteria bacterium]|nr:hypothetical protein [Betaproteobacteria bacterium]